MQEKLTDENKKQLVEDKNENNVPDILEEGKLDENGKTNRELVGPYLMTQLLSKFVTTDRLKEKVARAEGYRPTWRENMKKLIPFFIFIGFVILAFAFAHFYLQLF